MSTYSFTCPLEGCAVVMTSNATDMDMGKGELLEKATQHLQDVHPDIHKTPEEVTQNITLDMKVVGE